MTASARVRCVYGRTGMGKTTLAVMLAEEDSRVSARRGWRACVTRNAVKAAVIEGVRRGRFRIAYAPDARTTDPVAEADFLADVARAAQANYPSDPTPILFLIDEANLAFPTELARTARCAGIRSLILQGRHRGVRLLFVTQRPANIGADARANAGEVFAFSLVFPRDVAAVSEYAPEADRHLRTLAPFYFLRAEGGKCCVMTTHRGRPRAA
jgi:hypothetical protein